MFMLDVHKVKELHAKYKFEGPVLDAGGLNDPAIADYEISKAKAITLTYIYESKQYSINAPHPIQHDRYVKMHRPWSFIDSNYTVLNPEYGDPYIEDLPKKYKEQFNSVIMVSVLEHVDNPFVVCDAIFDILKPGGLFFNSTPFMFPYHPSPNDNFRFSPNGLKIVHQRAGFEVLESEFHVSYSSKDAIGDTNAASYGNVQPIIGSFILCRKPYQ